MFGLIKKMFVGLLIIIVHTSDHTKCTSLRNQKCMIQLTSINLDPNKWSQESHYYLFVVKLDGCTGSCNNLSNELCVPNKTEDLNLNVFNLITGINEWKTLTNMYYANVNVDLMEGNVIQINGGITINVDVNVKNVIYVKKIMLGILLLVIVKMENI